MSHDIPNHKINDIKNIIEKHKDEITNAWKEHFVLEVSHIDTKVLWLFVDTKEHYMPFDKFPWFYEASVKSISHVERESKNHFHWPDLDIDLTLDMIDHPDKYPNSYR